MDVPIDIISEAELPSPPFVDVGGIPNFRDLGGWPVKASPKHSIKRETIYRCAEPNRVTKDGISTIQRLGITHIYDLRSNTEIVKAEDSGRGGVVILEGTERIFVPGFSDKDYSPEVMAVRYEYYAGCVEVCLSIPLEEGQRSLTLGVHTSVHRYTEQRPAVLQEDTTAHCL